MKKESKSPQIIINTTDRLVTMSAAMRGVFSDGDLHNLIGQANPLTNSRIIKKFVESKILTKWKRGLYSTKNFDFWLLATRLLEKSYISMDSVLALNGLIGTISDSQVSVISTARNKTLLNSGYRINIYSISKNLFFGFVTNSNGVSIADNEKAFLDLLYYYIRGHKFIIDPLTEVNTQKLDIKKIKHYLKRYNNPKFIRFVDGVLDDYKQKA